MWKLIGWTGIAVFAVGGLWDLSKSVPTISPAVTAVILLGLGLLVGIRVGSDSASAYVKDLLRLNKYLAEQNDQLAELNHSHIKRQLAQDHDVLDSDAQDPDDSEEHENYV